MSIARVDGPGLSMWVQLPHASHEVRDKVLVVSKRLAIPRGAPTDVTRQSFEMNMYSVRIWTWPGWISREKALFSDDPAWWPL